jgi:uncharacterized protein YoxC
LIGNTDIEDSLQRLDRLTQEEAQMASAELLRVAHSTEDTVKGLEGKVQDVHGDVQDIGNKVQGVDDRVQGVGSDVKDISSEVRGVDRRVQDIGNDIKDDVRGVDVKLDQVNRSSSL